MRKVTIYSTKTKAQQVIETGVNTWGELKQLVNPEMGVNSSKCMVRENRTTLESNEAVLPAGDITIFLYPEKVKSGIAAKKDDAYASLSSAKLRKACQKKSLATTGTDSGMRTRLRAYDKRYNIDSTLPEAPKTTKNSKNLRPTTTKKVKKSTKKSCTTVGALQPTGVGAKAPQANLEKEAVEVANVEFNPKSEPLNPNSTISIHAVVKLMKNKFMNMFDEIEEQIAGGTLTSNEEILADEAEALAKEAGFAISETDY